MPEIQGNSELSLDDWFKHIRDLVNEKQYIEALDLLYDIEHPRAEKWIDQILKRIEYEEKHPETQVTLDHVRLTEHISTGTPWDPRWFLGMGAMIAYIIARFWFFAPYVWIDFALILTAIPLAFNWRRLGRRQWFLYNMLFVAGFIILRIIVAVSFLQEGMAIFPFLWGFNSLLLGLSYGLTFGIASLQYRTFKLWEADKVQAMLNYQYSPRDLIIGMVMGVILFWILLGASS